METFGVVAPASCCRLEAADKVAAACGIGHRHPLYDRRLVQFCYGIPTEQKLPDGWDRSIERRAMEGVVPEEIRCRMHKSHWAANFKRGLFDLHQTRLEQVIFHESDAIGEYVDIGALRAAYDRCRNGLITESDGMNVWTATTLSLWLQQNGMTA
jgi:asparagine synthase (glutamine-hydrolysing)